MCVCVWVFVITNYKLFINIMHSLAQFYYGHGLCVCVSFYVRKQYLNLISSYEIHRSSSDTVWRSRLKYGHFLSYAYERPLCWQDMILDTFRYFSLPLSIHNAIPSCLLSWSAEDDTLAPSRTTAVTGYCVRFRANYSHFVAGESYGRRFPTVASPDIITACN